MHRSRATAATILARASTGSAEAALVLDVATRLEELLKKQDVEVVLTRRTNAYVALEERTSLANRSDADLFLSIHANASTATSARGVETYFLNFAPNPEAEAIAARENAGSARSMRHLPDIVQAIALNNKLDESRDFATIVQSTLYRAAPQEQQDAEEPWRQAGAVHGARRRRDAERAGGDFVHEQPRGRRRC